MHCDVGEPVEHGLLTTGAHSSPRRQSRARPRHRRLLSPRGAFDFILNPELEEAEEEWSSSEYSDEDV